MPPAPPGPARRVGAMFDADELPFREREILRGITRHADAAGWQLDLDPFALHHTQRPWDGLLVPTRKGSGKLLHLWSIPAVCLGWSQKHVRVGRAIESRYAAGRLAARHLVERGYRSFAYVGFSRAVGSWYERDRFTRELRRLGRDASTARTFATFARGRRGWDTVMRALGEMLDKLPKPAGLFVARPGFARALADLALERGLRIPEDIGLIAADDEPLACERPPGITSIRFDYAEVGFRAAELLDRLMSGEPRPKQAVLVPPTLVPRQSTDRQRIGDPLVADALWWIDDRRTEPIRAPHVARAFGISARRLQRRFRRAGRDTVQSEILKARVEHAKLMLRDPRSTMRTAAHQAGFTSYASFLRAFKRHVGTPPSQWRP